MALALQHFQRISTDVGPLGKGLIDSVSALVGCVRTAAAHLDRLEDHAILELLARASHRADEVILITEWISEKHHIGNRDGSDAALRAIKSTVAVMLSDWTMLSAEQRERLLLITSEFLGRFCHLFRIDPEGFVSGLD